MNISQQTIAEQLGLSISTVSLALRDAPQVAEDTRQQVQALAEELGYKLPPRRISRVELVPEPIGQLTFLLPYPPDNPFYAAVIAGAEAECRRHGIALRCARVTDVDAATLKQYGETDALLVVGSVPEATVRQLQRIGRPLVLVDNNLPHLKLDRILIENVGSLYRLVERLAEQGHRHVAFVRGQAVPSFNERLQGFRNAVADLGLQATELFCEESSFVFAADMMTAWLQQHGRPAFSALIGCNDLVAIGAMHALQDAGIHVPGDVAIAGFDDVDVARMSRPTLTTCHVPREQLGVLGVRRLIERAADPSIIPQAVVLDTGIVERASTQLARTPADA